MTTRGRAMPCATFPLAAALWLAASGCQSTPRPGEPPVASGPAPASGVFGAVRMSVHPLTRIARDPDSGLLHIETHLEFSDRWGHGVKEVGILTFRMDRPNEPPMTWRLDLSDPGDSSRQYDPVTRTYVITLDDAPDWLDRTAVLLEVEFATLDGRVLSASRRVGR